MVLGLFGGLITDALPEAPDADRDPGDQDGPRRSRCSPWSSPAASRCGRSSARAFLGGLTNVVDMPTRQAFSVEMVGREDVGNAVALNSAMFNARARRSAPPSPASPSARSTSPTAFLIDARQLPRGARRAARDARERAPHARPLIARPTLGRRGLRRAARGPQLRPAHAARAARRSVVVGLVVHVRHELPGGDPAARRAASSHSDATGYGFLMAASGLGSLVAALFIAFSRRSRLGLIAGGAILVGVAEIALGLSSVSSSSLVADVLRRARARSRWPRRPTRRSSSPSPTSSAAGDERLHDGVRGVHAGRRPADGLGRVALRDRRGDGRSAGSPARSSGSARFAWAPPEPGPPRP